MQSGSASTNAQLGWKAAVNARRVPRWARCRAGLCLEVRAIGAADLDGLFALLYAFLVLAQAQVGSSDVVAINHRYGIQARSLRMQS